MELWLSTELATTAEKLEREKKFIKMENNNWYSDADSDYEDCLNFKMPSQLPLLTRSRQIMIIFVYRFEIWGIITTRKLLLVDEQISSAIKKTRRLQL